MLWLEKVGPFGILGALGAIELLVPFLEDEFTELRFVEGADIGFVGSCAFDPRYKSDCSLDLRVEFRWSVAVELRYLSGLKGCIIPKLLKLCPTARLEDEFRAMVLLFDDKE